MPERLIFCLTTGRTGTAYLAKMMSLLPGVSAHHEPAPPFEDWTRRAMVGKPCDAFWRESKLPGIAQLAGDAPVYVETNHVFKYLAESLLDLGQTADVIVLRRPSRKIALSYWRRGHYPARTQVGLRYFSAPYDARAMLPVFDWQRLSNYQLCYWYCLDTWARVGQLASLYRDVGARVFDTSLTEITTESGFLTCVKALGLPEPDRAAFQAQCGQMVNSLRSWLNKPSPEDIDAQETEVEEACQTGRVPPLVDRAEEVLAPPMPSNHRLQPGGSEYERYLWVRDQIPQGARVLDIGCNCGQLEANLYHDQWGCEVVGLDRYEPFIQNCQTGRKANYATWVLGDFTEMSDLDLEQLGTFDVVTALEVIEHNIGDPDQFLARVWRVLKPGGLFIVTTPHPDGFLGRAHMADHPRHVRMWNWESMECWAGQPVARIDLCREKEGLYSMGAVFRRPEGL